MKFKLLFIVFLVNGLQLFSLSIGGWGTLFVNKLDTEFTYTIKYFRDIDYKSFVVRLPPDSLYRQIFWVNEWFFVGITPPEEKQSLNRFNDVVEDIIVYDLEGNVIMTIDDIRAVLSKDDYVEEIEITQELAIAGKERYGTLPKFTGKVLNWRSSYFDIINKTNGIVYFVLDRNWDSYVIGWPLNPNQSARLYGFRPPFFENIDPMVYFYETTINIKVFTPDGKIIVTLDDFIEDRFTITRYGSEKYGDIEYMFSITEEDMTIGMEKYKDISPIDVNQEMKRVEEGHDQWLRGGL